MPGKKLLTAVALLLAATSAWSQSADEMIEMGRAQLEADRQKIVAANLVLTESESEAFWPAYREYRNDVAKLDDRMVSLLKEYSEDYLSLPDDRASALLNDAFKIDRDRLKLQEKYVKSFTRILPSSKVFRYMQIERRLDNMVRLQLQKDVPLALPAGKQ
jgi:hypothetical protein